MHTASQHVFISGIDRKAMNWKEIKQKENKDKFRTISVSVGRDSVFGIATRYGLDGPGIESRWREERRDFPHQSRTALGPTRPPAQWVQDILPGGIMAGPWHWPRTPSSAEVKERVLLYFDSPSGPSGLVLGWTLPLSRLVSKRFKLHSRLEVRIFVPKKVLEVISIK
jgi:hypothetical protein